MKFTKIGAYKLRNGQKQHIEAVLSDGTLVGLHKPGYTRSWCADGSFQPSGQSGYDIISEWVDPGPIPWTREEVPHGAIFRHKDVADGSWHMIMYTHKDHLYLCEYSTLSYACVATNFEHSTDNGVTWHPCHK